MHNLVQSALSKAESAQNLADELKTELDKVKNCNAQGKIMDASGNCISLSDPRIGTLQNGKYCTFSSNKLNCTSDVQSANVSNPSGSEGSSSVAKWQKVFAGNASSYTVTDPYQFIYVKYSYAEGKCTSASGSCTPSNFVTKYDQTGNVGYTAGKSFSVSASNSFTMNYYGTINVSTACTAKTNIAAKGKVTFTPCRDTASKGTGGPKPTAGVQIKDMKVREVWVLK